jgi:Predicted metal binding domain
LNAGSALRRERREQFVDLDVSRKKFEREISEFRELGDTYFARGWVLTHAEFPLVRVLMCAPQLKPAAIIVAVEFDFTNYDVEPPSVTLIEPFTNRPYTFDELPTVLKRSVPQEPPAGFPFPPGAQVVMSVQQPLMQAEEGGLPFLCIAGVREYHAHPAHSGDLWALQRESGAGRLSRLLEVIHRYGVDPVSDYQIQLALSVNGFIQNSFPE